MSTTLNQLFFLQKNGKQLASLKGRTPHENKDEFNYEKRDVYVTSPGFRSTQKLNKHKINYSTKAQYRRILADTS